MSPDETQLKKLLSESTPVTDENKALEQVLKKSSNVTAFKDVAGLFVGWCWVVLLGFGASAYSARRRMNLHQQQKKSQK
tara:strand:- start:1450 stop:1686 length:237 start_codon:yes stop_codon:yes gene_type:complete